MLAERGLDLTYETVRRWVTKVRYIIATISISRYGEIRHIIPAALASDSTDSQTGPAVIRCPFRGSQAEAELAVAITRAEFDAAGLRHAAARAKDADAARRMLALALVLDGRTRTEAAQTRGMDRQTLRDWVHRYNVEGLAGLSDRKAPGPTPRLSAGQCHRNRQHRPRSAMILAHELHLVCSPPVPAGRHPARGMALSALYVEPARVEEMLAERGLDLTYETVRRWVTKFGPLFARELRKRRQRPTGRWHLDEMASRSRASGTGYGGRWTMRARFSTSWCNHGATRGRLFG